ncbi:MAG: hypothetical protein IT229_09595 [Flavobacteriales bacterium]|nr:hypothetical protein [Flavobacteriales bacterium]
MTALVLALALRSIAPTGCDSVPVINQRVVAFVNDHAGKRVGTGECWDLAAQGLTKAGATWDGAYGFGRRVDPLKECVHPGDIIRFQGVLLRQTTETSTHEERMSEHTAVIMQVKGPGMYRLGHQNMGSSGRKVGFSDIDVQYIVKGKCTIYRPQ